MIGRLLLYGLACVGAMAMLGAGIIGAALLYFCVVEKWAVERQEQKQHATNLKALKRHWDKAVVEEH